QDVGVAHGLVHVTAAGPAGREMQDGAGRHIDGVAVVLGVGGAAGDEIAEFVAGNAEPPRAGRALPEAAFGGAVGALVQQQAARARLALDGLGLQAPVREGANRSRVVDVRSGALEHRTHHARVATSAMRRPAFSVPMAACMLRLTPARRAFMAASVSRRSMVAPIWPSGQV